MKNTTPCPQPSQTVSCGAVLAAIAVILGAFGAHALRGKIGYDLFDIFQTANQYMMIHATALIIYGLWNHSAIKDGLVVKPWPAICFFIGSIIFCGSLYTITFTGLRMFGAVTPVGGLLFIAGWLGFAYQARTRK
jgi:uncharacterized membrane protein YgdD (TMEM256/DUF423 family)